jgi:nucleotide-binding universal stress UspA family protein
MLVAVDGSPPSDAAVRVALQLGSAGSKRTIRFVSAFERGTGLDAALQAEHDACRSVLDAALSAARAAGLEATSSTRAGSPATEILREAQDWDASCTIVGTRGRSGFDAILFGSCAEGVLHGSSRPVLVVRRPTRPAGSTQRVLCAFGGSDSARRAFDAAVGLAAAQAAELHVISVIQLDDLYAGGYERDRFDPDGSIGRLYDAARRDLKNVAADAASGDVRIALHVAGGSDVAAIISTCAERFGCGLIVMGTHGRRGLTRAILGSTAEAVIRDANAPVLVVHDGSPRTTTPAVQKAAASAW